MTSRRVNYSIKKNPPTYTVVPAGSSYIVLEAAIREENATSREHCRRIYLVLSISDARPPRCHSSYVGSGGGGTTQTRTDAYHRFPTAPLAVGRRREPAAAAEHRRQNRAAVERNCATETGRPISRARCYVGRPLAVTWTEEPRYRRVAVVQTTSDPPPRDLPALRTLHGTSPPRSGPSTVSV